MAFLLRNIIMLPFPCYNIHMHIKTVGTGSLAVRQRSACTLIDGQILVDCGNGIVKTLLQQGVDLHKIHTILITHLHGDHFLDLPFLILQHARDSALPPMRIIGPRRIQEIVGTIGQLIFPDADWQDTYAHSGCSFQEVSNLEPITRYNYQITPMELSHGDLRPAYGYMLSDAKIAIGISGDTTMCPAVEDLLAHTDLSVLDATWVDSTTSHLGIKQVQQLADQYQKPIIATHLSDPARAYAVSHPHPLVTIPEDGDEFETDALLHPRA